MQHDIIDNRESYLADAVRPLLNESVRGHFAVGYFFLSGFKAIAKELEKVTELRLLIGNTSDRATVEQLAEGYASREAIIAKQREGEFLNAQQRAKLVAEGEQKIRERLERLDQTDGHQRGARVHLIHAKISGPPSGDDASQRLILRRFRIGPGERYRTASERLAKLDLNARPHIGTLELGHICDEAFDKEALTDEFFKKLDRHIRDIETDLQKHQPDLDGKEAFTQAQLLIERLVFLYFAQNRGWLNQDPEFLIKNFAKYKKDGDGFGYYQEFLHRLFRSLAEPSFGDRLEGIPFLNGGLFDDDEFRPPQSKLRIRNETFWALFNDLFEAYNFTVREDTPLSQEVAVDPEMLGKIFESIVLHRESAGTEYQAPNLRKATGSNYTPRIVVHFICREALRLYFAGRAEQLADHGTRHTWSARVTRLFKEIESDDGFNEHELKTLREILSPTEARRCVEILKSLRTLDPSVGSGAFPVGLLHEMVSLLRIFETVAGGYQDPVKGEGSTWKQKAKEYFIQNSLFGVDIQQQAIEICRLRLWLSLLVDYELGVNPFEAERGKFIEAINHISQLPKPPVGRWNSAAGHPRCGKTNASRPHGRSWPTRFIRSASSNLTPAKTRARN